MDTQVHTVEHIFGSSLSIDGNRVQATYLGGGVWSEAYKVGSDVYVFTHDNIKRMLMDLKGTPHIPTIEYVCTNPDGTDVYRMPFYADVERSDGDVYRLAQLIKDYYTDVQCNVGWSNYEAINSGVVEKVSSDPTVPKTLVAALEALYEKMQTEGSTPKFDLHIGNFGVDAEGNLILRDPVADFGQDTAEREDDEDDDKDFCECTDCRRARNPSMFESESTSDSDSSES